jgi:hypothetical protein
MPHTLGMTADEPRVEVATLTIDTPDGTFPLHSPGWPADVQRLRYRAADPDPEYVAAALAALHEACVELHVPVAFVAFVREASLPLVPVTATPAGLAIGAAPVDVFAGFLSAEKFPHVAFIVVNRTLPGELRTNVRHEAGHLGFRQLHPDDPGGHEGPSEDFARRFAGETID